MRSGSDGTQLRADYGPAAWALFIAAIAFMPACGEHDVGVLDDQDPPGSIDLALADLSTCGPTNMALNPAAAGFPSPLESDAAFAEPWSLVDGLTEYMDPTPGLELPAFDTHQVTVDFGSLVTFDQVTVWHHPKTTAQGYNVPGEVQLEVYDGAQWMPITDAVRSVTVCGDGQVVAPEECDDDNLDGTDSCTNDCRWNTCGDGILYDAVSDPGNPNALEECDDGNAVDADFCRNDCHVATCGDGVVNELLEGCEDGNSDLGDGCGMDENACAAQNFAALLLGACACQLPTCGDGVLDAGEVCDDGNNLPGDGCDPNCRPSASTELESVLGTYDSLPDNYAFSPVVGAKVRWSYNGDGPNVLGQRNEFVTAVTAGVWHSCALRRSGEVACWGDGSRGQLGHQSFSSSQTPTLVAGLSDAVSISAGAFHTCALRQSGAVACWGYNDVGQLGNGAFETSEPFGIAEPVAVIGLSDAVAVSAGGSHTCALRQSGEVMCWGSGSNGELGDGIFYGPSPSYGSAIPVSVVGLNDVTSIAAGDDHTCVLRQSGQVSCWGSGFFGQLGDGVFYYTPPPHGVSSPVAVFGLSDAVSVAAGAQHTCAIRQSGDTVCWGMGLYGQLGDGVFYTDSPNGVAVPNSVTGLNDALSIAGGADHTCALRQSGAVACWGWGDFGQLGNGIFYGTDPPGVATPVTVAALSDAVGLGAGTSHTCAAKANGEAACWGWGQFGQLGSGGTGTRNVPTKVFAPTSWQAWVYEITVNGCPEPIAPESTSGSVPAGGSLTTDSEGDGTTLADPVETTVFTPSAGVVSIDETAITQSPPSGFSFFGMQVNITAPPASVASPLLLEFTVDSSLLPFGADENDVQVFKDGTLVGDCLAAPSAIPDPCVAGRALDGDDVVITVLTTSASAWNFGVALPGGGDVDGDGVNDAADDCAGTPSGAVVDAAGCSIDQLCPCAGPGGSGDAWQNHGQYVSCVAQAANVFRSAGLLGASERGPIVSAAAQSDCGQP